MIIYNLEQLLLKIRHSHCTLNIVGVEIKVIFQIICYVSIANN